MVATIFILFVAKSFGIVKYPDLSRDTFKKIWPLPLFYLGKKNILTLPFLSGTFPDRNMRNSC